MHRQSGERHEQFQSQQPRKLTAQEQGQICVLASELPKLWYCMATGNEEDRNVISRQIIERGLVHAEVTGHAHGAPDGDGPNAANQGVSAPGGLFANNLFGGEPYD